ncbi:hypothetical protein QTP88_009549 [Uroleucon formosanum]
MNREKIMDTYTKLCSNSNCLINTDTLYPFTTSPFWPWSPKINTQLLHFQKNSTSHTTITAIFNEILLTKFHDFKHIYTDASKTNIGVGFAYCTCRTSKCFKLLPEASIFTAETQAIKEALLFANSTSTNNILIISDSLSALLAIEAPNPSNEIIYQIHNIISSTQKLIEFIWVPSHTGIPGNEKADTLANEAITSISSTSISTLPYQDIKRIINTHTTNMWQKSWDEIPMSNKLKSIKKKVTKWNLQPNIPRRSEVINTRTRIGHTNLTHIHIIKHEEHPLLLCNDYYDKIDKYNKFVPDYDIIKEKEKDFSSYYFRNSKYAGQLKVRPKTFFKSLYNCDYLVLPELKDSNNNYTAYKNTILTKISSFMSELSNYGKIYKNLKDDEINLVAKYEESYEAAKNAHIKIKEYEDHSSDENKISKEIAIMNYLSNQMSEIPDIKYNDYYEHNGHTNHMFKNYEIYADATDEIYYYSNIWKEKYHTVKTCDTFLTEDEYDNILFCKYYFKFF